MSQKDFLEGCALGLELSNALPNIIRGSKKYSISVIFLPLGHTCFHRKEGHLFVKEKLYNTTYQEKCFIKAREAPVRGADGVQELNCLVEVVERAYCLVQGAHHLGGVFGQLERTLLLLLGFQFSQLREQRQQLFVFLKQPERVARAKSITTIRPTHVHTQGKVQATALFVLIRLIYRRKGRMQFFFWGHPQGSSFDLLGARSI